MARLRIKEETLRQGLRQKDVIERAGVSPQLMNRYWNNYTRSVALDQLQKIANALRCKPGDLIVEDGEVAQEEDAPSAA